MAVITPQSDVYLLKVPLEINDINQLTFSNATAQFNYFNSLPKITADNFTYQRKDGTIRFPGHFDDLLNYNYVMYRNDAYSNKWFYAFITGMEYLNDNVTAIAIKTDVWQTYQFDLTYKRCFVEREHVNDDSFGLHTIPENLETGEYIRGNNGVDFQYNGEYWLCFQVTELISNMNDDASGGRIYNGIYNGLIIVMVDNYNTADLLVSAYDDAGKHEAIISCFYIPKSIEPNPIINQGVTLHGETCDVYYPRRTNTARNMGSLTINRPTTIDGYTPKNNKLFTKEFCYIYLTNNSGSDVNFSYEDFRNNTGTPISSPSFQLYGSLCQGCSIKIFPDNTYKAPIGNDSANGGGYSYGISAGKLPLCSWNSDYYTNWITQNAVNISSSALSTGFSTGVSLITGNLVGTAGSLISGISDIVSKKYQASVVPNQAKGNVNCGDINFSLNKQISIYPMNIRREYAVVCDNYLSMFGYKVSEVKLPNITGRRNWNYVKTIGCYIEADIPQGDLQEIKSMFDKGITLWHNPATFMDYSQNNDII